MVMQTYHKFSELQITECQTVYVCLLIGAWLATSTNCVATLKYFVAHVH